MAKVLFIDDDFFTLETYEKILSLYGHEALLAETGKKGLNLAQNASPEIIFLDRQMPDMDGFSILKQLRTDQLTADIPVIMLTASRDEFAKRAKDEGAQGFAAKPLRAKQLVDLIEEYAVA
jgi:CheY-like chemotaxis protein